MKAFNITGTCFPDRHYMVDITDRVAEIKKMVDKNQYFCINRARQYGKTTTLHALRGALADDYEVYAISFEGLDLASYETDRHLAYAMIELMDMASMGTNNHISEPVRALVSQTIQAYAQSRSIHLNQLTRLLIQMNKAASKPLVLIIDEVDQASNYDAFVRILGVLRKQYLERDNMPTFQSVILAGVYDIQNLKPKIRPDAEHAYNSPWNIATHFEVDMGFNVQDVAGMLQAYENDHHTGMDIPTMAQRIIDETGGYPFLVSRLCMILDEKIKHWDKEGILKAEKCLLGEKNTLFDDFTKKLDNFPKIYHMLYALLYQGKTLYYNINDHTVNLATMLGYIENNHGKLEVSNRIFETWLYNLFAAKEQMSEIFDRGSTDKNQCIQNDQINMEYLLTRFATHFNEIYGKNDDAFIEKMGRKLFLLYLKPIINGIGNYYIEAQTRDETRTDVIIDYLGQQYIIELKIWRGDAYNQRGEEQIAGYLDYFHAKKGYLLSFCFNKNKTRETKTIQVRDKTIFEVIV